MRVLLAILAGLALFNPVAADHCTGYSTSQSERDTCDLEAVFPCIYFESDPCEPQCGTTLYIYQESNGIEGLQRGDELIDDTCHGMIAADTMIF